MTRLSLEASYKLKFKKPKSNPPSKKKVDITKLKSNIKNCSNFKKKTHIHNDRLDINSVWSCVKINIHQMIDDHVPTKMTSNPCPQEL